jgi:hexosaminidase
MLSADLSRATGFQLPVRAGGVMPRNVGNILLELLPAADPVLGNEGYRVKVTNAMVTISANKAAGLFYGAQTFLQLLPKDIESRTTVEKQSWKAPVVDILDYPRFGWRGIMFDVSRHFFTKSEVKQFIDDMAKYKYNLLHFHLTDDEGWRIEIKSYPKLTTVGAWNVKKVGTFGDFTPPKDDEPRDFGGFYTQEDLKELVQYAKERFVNIMPEVDVPGHSLAAIASYPELSCTPGADKYKVRSGEKIMNWYAGGFSAIVDNTLCPANEKVYAFLDKVFSEVAQIFPFEYIHMGGDECAKNFWEKNPQILDLMKRENLKDMHEVQHYFVKRVEKIVTSKGKKLLGWDEILEGGGLPGSAGVMSWRSIQGGIDAAKQGHEVVMTPSAWCYIDYMQADKAIEPPVYATLRLKKAYSFDPVPDGVDAKLVKGGQANLWTEQIWNYRHLQYMTWPRSMATAEALWSPRTSKNWPDFTRRVEDHFSRFDAAGKKYAPSMFDPIVKAKKADNGTLMVETENEIDGLDSYYSFDNSFPDQYYPKMNTPVAVPVDAAPLKVINYRNGKPVGRLITIPIEELKKRAGVK